MCFNYLLTMLRVENLQEQVIIKMILKQRFFKKLLAISCAIFQIRELEPVLCHASQTSQLIWTSSSNAHRSAFNLEDIQHQGGTQPYSSSKYASDLLSLALNTHYNKQVGSHTPHTHVHVKLS